MYSSISFGMIMMENQIISEAQKSPVILYLRPLSVHAHASKSQLQ